MCRGSGAEAEDIGGVSKNAKVSKNSTAERWERILCLCGGKPRCSGHSGATETDQPCAVGHRGPWRIKAGPRRISVQTKGLLCIRNNSSILILVVSFKKFKLRIAHQIALCPCRVCPYYFLRQDATATTTYGKGRKIEPLTIPQMTQVLVL